MQFIWAKGLRDQMSTNVAFTWKGKTGGEAVTLEICAVNLYRLYVNGRFLACRPFSNRSYVI